MQVITHPKGERWKERREYERPVGSHGYTDTIKQIELVVVRHLEEHDRVHQQKKEERQKIEKEQRYTPNYSLTNHNFSEGELAAKVAALLQFSPWDINVVRTAGRWHDFGKTKPDNWFYRFPRSLTQKELARKHAHAYEGAALLRRYIFKHFVLSAEEGVFVSGVLRIIEHHHVPKNESDPRLRSLTVIVKCTDTFISLQEDRPERMGLSFEVALGILRMEIATHWTYDRVREEATRVADTIGNMYHTSPTQEEVDEERDSKSR